MARFPVHSSSSVEVSEELQFKHSTTAADHWHTFDYTRPHIDGLLLLQRIKEVSLQYGSYCLVYFSDLLSHVHLYVDEPSECEGFTTVRL